MLELTKHAFEFRLEEYKKGQNIKVEKNGKRIFLRVIFELERYDQNRKL